MNALTIPQKLDIIELWMLTFPQVECALEHHFTPGLYSRQIFNPKGTFIITKTHKTEHQFVISKGKLSIWTEDDGVKTVSAPYFGITKPGTRRLIFSHEDTVFTTFHANPDNETDIAKLEEVLIEHNPPKLLGVDLASLQPEKVVVQLLNGGTP